jgi:membrane dipeptidase
MGTDLDGGFGTEQTPGDLNSIADVHKLQAVLDQRGYRDGQIDNIFFGNWLRFFGRALPDGGGIATHER